MRESPEVLRNVLDLELKWGCMAIRVCENLSVHLERVHFSILCYISKKKSPNEVLAPPPCLPDCAAVTQGRARAASLHRGLKRMACAQAVDRRAYQSRNASGFPRTLALCGSQFPHV